jgi:hypothetical protein
MSHSYFGGTPQRRISDTRAAADGPDS